MSTDEKPLKFLPPATAKKKEKKKHVHSEVETKDGLTILSALMGTAKIPSKYLQGRDEGEEMKKGHKPFRVNMFTYGHRQILFSEVFGIRYSYSNGQPMVDRLRGWVVVGKDPVRMPDSDIGTFCGKDAYLFLAPSSSEHTSDDETTNFVMFVWIGEETSAIKRAVVAALSSQLQICLGGHVAMMREEQDFESDSFLETLIKAGVRGGPKYLPAGTQGTEEGFEHIKPRVPPRKLFRVPADPKSPITEEKPELSSLNTRDAFVLLAKGTTFVWWKRGLSTAAIGRAYGFAQETKAYFRQTEVNCMWHDHFDVFWSVLGVKLPIDEATVTLMVEEEQLKVEQARVEQGEDAVPEASHGISYTMKVNSNKKGSKPKLEQTKGEDEPLLQSSLATTCGVIVDCEANMFVWKGHKLGMTERRLTEKCAQSIMDEYDRPDWSILYHEFEGAESPVFRARWMAPKQHLSWQTHIQWIKQQKANNLPISPYPPQPTDEQQQTRENRGNNTAEKLAVKVRGLVDEMMSKPQIEVIAEEKVLDFDYTSKDYSVVDVWLMTGKDPKFAKVGDEDKGIFYSGNSYLVLNRVWDNDGELWIHHLCFWKGADCTTDWYSACMLGFLPSLKRRLQAGGRCKIIEACYDQQREPDSFLDIFGNQMVVHKGCYDEDEPDVSLYHIYMRGTSLRAIQIPARGDLLDSKDCYALLTSTTCFFWLGKECPSIARTAALHVIPELEGDDRNTIVFDERIHYCDFWESVGGWKKSVQWLPEKHRPAASPRVWRCFNASFAGLAVDELTRGSLGAADFDARTALIIDFKTQMYVWIGAECTPTMQREAVLLAKEYAKKTARSVTMIDVVQAGKEPFVIRRLLGGASTNLSRFTGMKNDPRSRYLIKNGRDLITGVKLNTEEAKALQQEIIEEDEEEPKEEEEEEEEQKEHEEIELPEVTVKVDWSKVGDIEKPTEPKLPQHEWAAKSSCEVKDEADLKASGEDEEDEIVYRRVERAPDLEDGMRHPPGAISLYEEEEETIAQPIEPQQQEEEEEEEEEEDEEKSAPCDYCQQETSWAYLRSTPIEIDRKHEQSGMCKECWLKNAADKPWPKSRAAQHRAERAVAAATATTTKKTVATKSVMTEEKKKKKHLSVASAESSGSSSAAATPGEKEKKHHHHHHKKEGEQEKSEVKEEKKKKKKEKKEEAAGDGEETKEKKHHKKKEEGTEGGEEQKHHSKKKKNKEEETSTTPTTPSQQ